LHALAKRAEKIRKHESKCVKCSDTT
jgi:hypothetical protein